MEIYFISITLVSMGRKRRWSGFYLHGEFGYEKSMKWQALCSGDMLDRAGAPAGVFQGLSAQHPERCRVRSGLRSVTNMVPERDVIIALRISLSLFATSNFN